MPPVKVEIDLLLKGTSQATLNQINALKTLGSIPINITIGPTTSANLNAISQQLRTIRGLANMQINLDISNAQAAIANLARQMGLLQAQFRGVSPPPGSGPPGSGPAFGPPNPGPLGQNPTPVTRQHPQVSAGFGHLQEIGRRLTRGFQTPEDEGFIDPFIIQRDFRRARRLQTRTDSIGISARDAILAAEQGAVQGRLALSRSILQGIRLGRRSAQDLDFVLNSIPAGARLGNNQEVIDNLRLQGPQAEQAFQQRQARIQQNQVLSQFRIDPLTRAQFQSARSLRFLEQDRGLELFLADRLGFGSRQRIIEEEAARRGVNPATLTGARGRPFDFARLASRDAIQQLAFAGLFGGLPSLIGGGILGGVGGPGGVLLGSVIGQIAGRKVTDVIDGIKSSLERASEAGKIFERSILGIQAVLQENTRFPGGSLSQQLNLQQQRARGIQLGARKRLLPLGIAGAQEATFVQGITAALASRGIVANESEISDIAGIIGGAVVTQRPQLLENTTLLLRDIQDVLGGGALAQRTVLSQLIRPAFPRLQQASSAGEIIGALSPVKELETTAKSADNVIVLFRKLEAALDNLFTSAGDAFVNKLKPGLSALTGVISDEKFVRAASNLASNFGGLTSGFFTAQSALLKLVATLSGLPQLVFDLVGALVALKTASILSGPGSPAGRAFGLLPGIAGGAAVGLGGSLARNARSGLSAFNIARTGGSVPSFLLRTVGGRLGAGLAGQAIPVAGQAIGLALLASTLFELGQGVFGGLNNQEDQETGVDFDETKPGLTSEATFRSKLAKFGLSETFGQEELGLVRNPKSIVRNLRSLRGVFGKTAEGRKFLAGTNAGISGAIITGLQGQRDREQGVLNLESPTDLRKSAGLTQQFGGQILQEKEQQLKDLQARKQSVEDFNEVSKLQAKFLPSLLGQLRDLKVRESALIKLKGGLGPAALGAEDELKDVQEDLKLVKKQILNATASRANVEKQLADFSDQEYALQLDLLGIKKDIREALQKRLTAVDKETELEAGLFSSQTLGGRKEISGVLERGFRRKAGEFFTASNNAESSDEADRLNKLGRGQLVKAQDQILEQKNQLIEEVGIRRTTIKSLQDFQEQMFDVDLRFKELARTTAQLDRTLQDFKDNELLRSLGRRGQQVSAAEKVVQTGGDTSRIPLDVLRLTRGSSSFDDAARQSFDQQTSEREFEDVFRQNETFRGLDTDREKEESDLDRKSSLERERDIRIPRQVQDSKNSLFLQLTELGLKAGPESQIGKILQPVIAGVTDQLQKFVEDPKLNPLNLGGTLPGIIGGQFNLSTTTSGAAGASVSGKGDQHLEKSVESQKKSEDLLNKMNQELANFRKVGIFQMNKADFAEATRTGTTVSLTEVFS